MRADPQVAVIVSRQIELSEIDELASCNDQQFSDIINLCFSEYAPQETSVELCLMNEKEHCAAHQRFLNDPSATDVMAFPYDDDDCCGELLVNVEMALRRAPEFSHSPVHELLLYVVHGTLHLLGFDDHQPQDIEKMRAAEQNVLQQAIETHIF